MQYLLLLRQLILIFLNEESLLGLIILFDSHRRHINPDISLASPGNPYINLTLQLLGKNNFEPVGPMDSYTNHPWVKKVLLSN
jgi:hypothetical protein